MLLFVLKPEQAAAIEHSLKEEVHFSSKVPSFIEVKNSKCRLQMVV